MKYTYEEIKQNIGKYAYYIITGYTHSKFYLEEFGVCKIYGVNALYYSFPIIIRAMATRGDLMHKEIFHIFPEDNKLVKLLIQHGG